MSEQRFIVESVEIISDCNENKKRIAKVITDTDEIYSYEDLYEIKDLLNEMNKDLKDCEKALETKDDFIHKFKKDIEELNISIALFEDDAILL